MISRFWPREFLRFCFRPRENNGGCFFLEGGSFLTTTLYVLFVNLWLCATRCRAAKNGSGTRFFGSSGSIWGGFVQHLHFGVVSALAG